MFCREIDKILLLHCTQEHSRCSSEGNYAFSGKLCQRQPTIRVGFILVQTRRNRIASFRIGTYRSAEKGSSRNAWGNNEFYKASFSYIHKYLTWWAKTFIHYFICHISGITACQPDNWRDSGNTCMVKIHQSQNWHRYCVLVRKSLNSWKCSCEL